MTLVLSQYGVSLKRVEQGDIELIRKWRNSPEIRKTMSYRQYISKSQQEKWFNKIDNKYNYYFLINVNEKPIGVINCKDVNVKEQFAEGGVFIWDSKYLNSPYPVIASLILLDFIFNELAFAELSFVRVLSANDKAQKYNKQLGYVKLPNQESVNNQWYVLHKKIYNQTVEKLRVGAKNFSEGKYQLKVTGSVSDKNISELNEYLTSG